MEPAVDHEGMLNRTSSSERRVSVGFRFVAVE